MNVNTAYYSAATYYYGCQCNANFAAFDLVSN